MDSTGCKLDVVNSPNGFIVAIQDVGPIEQFIIKQGENPTHAIEEFCKKHCLGLMKKHSLLLECHQKINLIRSRQESRVLDRSIKDDLGCEGVFASFSISTVKGENDKDVGEAWADACNQANSYHRRNKSDGFPLNSKPLQTLNSNFFSVSVRPSSKKTQTKRSVTPFRTPFQALNTQSLDFTHNKNHKNPSKLIKPAKRQFPINNISDCLLKLQKQTKIRSFSSTKKFFSPEQAEKIQKRLEYLVSKETFAEIKHDNKLI